MKEKIFTIPLKEAFDQNSECPICAFAKIEEQKLAEYVSGASMMEPDVREVTNKKGFCNRHLSMILQTPNKLSTALIMETHMDEILKRLKNCERELQNPPKKLFIKEEQSKAEMLGIINNSCEICDKMDIYIERFIETFFYLYEKEEDFRQRVLASKGLCMPHFTAVLSGAEKHLSKGKRLEFEREIFKLQAENFGRVLDDLKWFAKKFDYRFKDADWKNSRDALLRSAQKLVSFTDE